MTAQVRAALPADVDAVVALVESAYRGEPSRAGWTTEADLLAGRRTGADEVLPLVPSLLLAEVDGELVACCALVVHDDHGYFGMFAVRPGLQGAGIGSRLLSAAEERARRHGLTRVEMTVLTARPELIAWYVRRGYVDTGQTRPFPYGDARFGAPLRPDLQFCVLSKSV